MKAKTKLTKLWSFLLSLVMLLSLMPGTVLAASPDASNVYVDGDKNFYNSTRLYYINGDSDGNFTGNASNYNAAYDPATGTLTLKDYNGKGIMVGGVGRTDITVKLVGTNIINDGSLENAVGGDITVTSSDGGTLSITRTLNGSNAAIGIETGLSASYTTGNVTIKGNAKVTINMTHNGTSTYEKAYGIFAKENITISENASVDITCATPNNTTGGGNCNGLYAAKDVTIDTNGTIKIDVTNAGKDKDNGYSYGVYHMRTATLTKVGNMEVQWKKEDNNTNYPGGAFTKGATFSDTDHAINVDTTNCYASYRCGSPYTVTVQNGTVTGPGVPNASGSGMFLENDTVSIKADTKTGNSGENIPFKGWTSSDVTLTSPTTASNSFTVPGKDVTVTAMHSPFYGTPVFTRTSDSSGTIAFQTVVKPDNSEFFEYVKNGETTYNGLYPQPTTSSGASPYEYSVSASTYYAGDIKYLEAGDYRMAVTLNGERYLSDPFTVDYTAAPTGNYPDHVRVYNGSGTITSLSDGQCLATNAATGAIDYISGDTYVARYDQSKGTLYLNGYQNDHQIIAPDSVIFANGDLNIEVVSDSSFSTSVSATSDLHGIRANGTLNISGSGKLTVSANGDGSVYGIYADKGVTISAPLKVQVGKVDSTKNGSLYGIYTKSGAISLSGNDMTVTATDAKETVYGVYNAADTSTAITENGNITISGNLTVNLSKGNNRGISSQGGVITLEGATVKIPGNYRYGIFNRNGNVVIKSTSDVDISSDISNNNGICTYSSGDLTIENSAVKVSAKGLPASVEYGTLSIKDSFVDLILEDTSYLVVQTHSNAANTINLSGRGTVTLTAPGEQTNAMIGGTVSLVGNTKCEMGKENGSSYNGLYDTASNTTVLQFVHEDPAPATYTVSFDANGGTGTMADVTGVSGEYTLPANGFTAPAGKQFKGWATSADGTAIPGTTIDVTADTTLYAIWENIPVTEHAITVTNGKATVGAGTEISKAAEGTTVTLTANAASDGQMFDKWEVVSGSITLADETSETTTFVMPAGAVSVKATYRFYITINLAAGEGSGTMEPLILKSNTYGYYDLIAPDCTFTPPANKVFDKWQFSKDDSYLKPGDTKAIWSSANGSTLTAIWKDAPVTYYTVSFDSNGGTGTMADVTGVSGEYTLPENGFTAPDGKHFKCWSVDGVEKAVGDKITVTANTTVTAVWEAIEYNVTVTGGTASVGAGTPITKATMGTTVTLTAGAAPSGQMFDKWEVVSGSITLADANSATTTFTMPAGAVSVKATYKDAPHTHTFDQEIIKDEALKTAADCTHDAVYYKSCECGKIGDASTAGTFEYEDSALGHDWSEGWSKDADKHWHECNRCHEKKDNAAHGYKSGVCTVCGAKDPDYKPPVNPFVDVSESSVYYDAILWAYYHEPQQITGGYTATEFRPGNPCTRGQVVTFLWRAAGCPEPTGDTSMFKDGSSIAAPYQKAVAWAVEKGITTGFADGTFRPNDSVTRAQFVTFLWRYENRPATSGSIAGFTDASSIAEPYQQAVAWAVEKGITTGYNDGSFRPNATCTRWAVVLFMYRDMT